MAVYSDTATANVKKHEDQNKTPYTCTGVYGACLFSEKDGTG